MSQGQGVLHTNVACVYIYTIPQLVTKHCVYIMIDPPIRAAMCRAVRPSTSREKTVTLCESSICLREYVCGKEVGPRRDFLL